VPPSSSLASGHDRAIAIRVPPASTVAPERHLARRKVAEIPLLRARNPRHARCIDTLVMASQTHLVLRLAALALLVAVAVWPRSRSVAHAPREERAHELVRTSVPHTLETAARALRHRTAAPEVVADVDEAALTN
jgi:hypothetical protein